MGNCPALLDQDAIPAKGQGEIADDDRLVLIGYPAQMSRYSEDKRQQGFESVTYWYPPADISFDKNGGYQLEWKDAAVWRGNRTFDLPAPKGMSGAPLWRFRKPSSSSIWSASEIGRIVAVQAAWDKKEVLFLEPVGKWSAWFHECFTIIDKDFGKVSG